jgi:hypothetical protein
MMRMVFWYQNAGATAPDTGQGGDISIASETALQLWANDSSADRTASMAFRMSVEHSAATSNLRTRQQAYIVSVL